MTPLTPIMAPIPEDVEKLAKEAVEAWLDQFEGFSMRAERLSDDIHSGKPVEPWLRSAWELGFNVGRATRPDPAPAGVEEALRTLEAAARKVQRCGAVTGPQWVQLSAALIEANAALSAPRDDDRVRREAAEYRQGQQIAAGVEIELRWAAEDEARTLERLCLDAMNHGAFVYVDREHRDQAMITARSTIRDVFARRAAQSKKEQSR